MQIQTVSATKPVMNTMAEKKPTTTQESKAETKAEKKPKFMKYGPSDLALSLQRKRARKAALEAAIKVLDAKIEAREKRLKEISPKQ